MNNQDLNIFCMKTTIYSNSLLEKYYNNDTIKCEINLNPILENYFNTLKTQNIIKSSFQLSYPKLLQYFNIGDSCDKVNILATKLLTCKIGIRHRLSGFHRLLLIIKNDLEDLYNSNIINLPKTLLSRISGKSSIIDNVKKLILDIIKILHNLTKPQIYKNINLKDDIEDPLILSIAINIMGSENNIKDATIVFEQLFIYVMHKYVSKWGLLNYKRIEMNDSVKNAIYKIISFYLYNSMFGYMNNFITKRLLNFSDASIKIVNFIKYVECKTKKNCTNAKQFNSITTMIDNFILEINNDIQNTYNQIPKSNIQKCKINNKYKIKSSINSKICINKSIIYKNNKVENNKVKTNIKTYMKDTIIDQIYNNSIIAQTFATCEYKNLPDSRLNIQELSGLYIDKNKITNNKDEQLTNKIIEILQENIINYDTLNCLFCMINKLNLNNSKFRYVITNNLKNSLDITTRSHKYINSILIEWGLIPNKVILNNNGISENISVNNNKILNKKKKAGYINNENYNCDKEYMGILDIDNENNNTLADFFFVTNIKKNFSSDNKYSFYSIVNAKSYKYQYTDNNIITNKDDKDDIDNKISAILNYTDFFYEVYIKKNEQNEIHVILNYKISHDDKLYIPSVIFNQDILNDMIEVEDSNNNLYKINKYKKKIFENKIKELFKDGVKIMLNLYTIDDEITTSNKSSFTQKFSKFIKQPKINKIKKMINIICSFDEDMNHIIIPKYTLFSPNEIDFAKLTKKSLYGGNKTILELKNICKNKNFKQYSHLNKTQLISLLQNK